MLAGLSLHSLIYQHKVGQHQTIELFLRLHSKLLEMNEGVDVEFEKKNAVDMVDGLADIWVKGRTGITYGDGQRGGKVRG